jgi:hypothetical protein
VRVGQRVNRKRTKLEGEGRGVCIILEKCLPPAVSFTLLLNLHIQNVAYNYNGILVLVSFLIDYFIAHRLSTPRSARL